MKELLIASAYSPRQGGKIINPLKFIEFVENSNLAEKQLDENKVREEDVSQNPVGFWKSVDFVDSIEDFVPGQKLWSGDLHLKSMVFKKDGTTSSRVTWKKTRIIDRSSKASAEFVIKKLNGRTYMFFPWLSGDVTIRGMKPSYYVLQKSER
jgi:bla regulator protein BlaR1